MKPRNKICATAIATVMLGCTPALAHEGHDHSKKKLAQSEVAQVTANRVLLKLFQYQPERLQVAQGAAITWINDDEIFHTVTIDSKDKSFDAPLDGKGKSFTFTFTQPGLYTYYCDRHEHMRGEIEVR